MKKLSHPCASKMGPLSVGVALLASLFSAHAAVDPMTVSAGDVNQTSAVLWAHSAVPERVRLDFSTDPTFTTGVRSIHLREHDALVPVKALVSHLSPATAYFHRAIGPAASASGKFWTPPRDGTFAGLRFGVSGDEPANWPRIHPSVTLRTATPTFFLQFGDNIYADFPSPDVPLSQCRTLTDFRAKTNEAYSTR